MTTDDLSATVEAERTEAALNPDRTHTPPTGEVDDRDTSWVNCGEGACYHWRHDLPCPADPWWCSCGEPVPINEPACTHGYFLCADHVDRCPECVAEKADARDDFDRKYRLENY